VAPIPVPEGEQNTMIPNNKLPKFIRGISVDPRDRLEYEDAMSNLMRLVDYQALNDDLLTAYDYQVMMKLETERDRPRPHVLTRIKGWFNVERTYNEMNELMELFD
jgi:hypothetical protein